MRTVQYGRAELGQYKIGDVCNEATNILHLSSLQSNWPTV